MNIRLILALGAEDPRQDRGDDDDDEADDDAPSGCFAAWVSGRFGIPVMLDVMEGQSSLLAALAHSWWPLGERFEWPWGNLPVRHLDYNCFGYELSCGGRGEGLWRGCKHQVPIGRYALWWWKEVQLLFRTA